MKNILLLHGAIGSKQQFKLLEKQLNKEYSVLTFNFPGHGGNLIPERGFSMELFAESVIKFLDSNKLEKVSVFGYSMGGYVGMYLAKNFPERIEKLITLATKFHWDESTSKKEVQMLSAEKIEAKIPVFANELKERHHPVNWKEVVEETAKFLIKIGIKNPLESEDYHQIGVPALILLGDRDKMVTLDETVNVFKLLPNAQLGILPGTPHPLEQVNLEVLLMFIKKFMVTQT